MARCVNALMSGSASGSVGSMTFSKAKGGQTCRKRQSKSRRSNNATTGVRAWMGWASRGWGRLTAGERQRWEDYSRLVNEGKPGGSVSRGTGFHEFTAVNTIRVRNGLSMVGASEPPSLEETGILSSFLQGAGADPGDVVVTWSTSGVVGSGDKIELGISGMVSSDDMGEVPRRWKWKASVTAMAGEVTIKGLRTGGRYYARGRFVRADGRASAYVILPVVAEKDPASWTPALLTLVKHWWRGDLGVTLVGEGVSKWVDQVGGCSAAQSLVGSRPFMTTVGGKPGILFDGLNDSLAGSYLVNLINPVVVIVVEKEPTINGTNRQTFDSTTSERMTLRILGVTNCVGINGGASLESTLIPPPGNQLVCYRLHFDGLLSSIVRDGIVLKAGNAGSSVRKGIKMGCSFVDNQYGDVKIAEIVMVGVASISLTEMTKLSQYIYNRYGLSAV